MPPIEIGKLFCAPIAVEILLPSPNVCQCDLYTALLTQLLSAFVQDIFSGLLKCLTGSLSGYLLWKPFCLSYPFEAQPSRIIFSWIFYQPLHPSFRDTCFVRNDKSPSNFEAVYVLHRLAIKFRLLDDTFPVLKLK